MAVIEYLQQQSLTVEGLELSISVINDMRAAFIDAMLPDTERECRVIDATFACVLSNLEVHLTHAKSYREMLIDVDLKGKRQ